MNSNPLDERYLGSVVTAMQASGVRFAAGMTDDDIHIAEQMYGFRFCPDLRALLQFALPVGERFPDWTRPDAEELRASMDWPADGICFDIEHNGFWLDEWGPRPASPREAEGIARRAVERAPALIPIYGHRYLPDRPCKSGNPVFSVYQTDIIYYGFSLASYLQNEFGVPNPFAAPMAARPVELWTDLCA